ncbi:MAG: GYD domain-containing protein [Phycisphaera sp.]|nr:GYD domain-containing protein [Phycisphaera sp.]
MARYIALIDFTDKGVAEFAETTARADAFREMAGQLNITVGDVYWTTGNHDGVLFFDAPDRETATAAMFALSSQGYVRTHTMDAFNQAEMQQVLEKAWRGAGVSV